MRSCESRTMNEKQRSKMNSMFLRRIKNKIRLDRIRKKEDTENMEQGSKETIGGERREMGKGKKNIQGQTKIDKRMEAKRLELNSIYTT